MTTRFKRRGQKLWKWTERLHIPLPVGLKAAVLREARENRVSVAAWGFGIVAAAVDNPLWLRQAMALLTEREAKAATATSRPRQ